MNRRTFVQGVVLTALGAPAIAQACPMIRARSRRVGVLGHVDPTGWRLVASTIELECRWTEGEPGRLGDLATDLVHREVDLVVALGTDCARAVRSASSTVPLVVIGESIPREWRGTEVTGIVVASGAEVARRRLALLRQLVPDLKGVAVLGNGDSGSSVRALDDLRAGAARDSTDIAVLDARNAEGIRRAFGSLPGPGTGALIVLPDPLFAAQACTIVDLAAERRIPAVYPAPFFVEAGGLAALHGDLAALIRCAAMLVARVLGGERPAALPIERFDALHLTLNRRTASAFGITVAGFPGNDPAVVRVAATSAHRVAQLVRRDHRAPRVLSAY